MPSVWETPGTAIVATPGTWRGAPPHLTNEVSRRRKSGVRQMTNNGDSKTREVPSPGRAFSAGQLIAERFQVVRLLGTGGLGEVYEVMDQALGTSVALKILKPGVSTDPVLLERFRR